MAWRAPKYSAPDAAGVQTIIGYDYVFGDRPHGNFWEGIADADVPKPPAQAGAKAMVSRQRELSLVELDAAIGRLPAGQQETFRLIHQLLKE